MRLYTVTNRQTGDVTLVEADSQVQNTPRDIRRLQNHLVQLYSAAGSER